MGSSAPDFRGMDVPSALWAPVRWVAVHMLAFAGLLLAVWIVDWVYVSQVWPEGVVRLEQILVREVAGLAQVDCWCGDLEAVGVATANGLYRTIFGITGVHAMMDRMAEGGPLSVPDSIARQFLTGNAELVRTLMVSTQLFGVRTAALAAVLPLMAVAVGVGLADGLVQRAARRARGGKESAGSFHRLKYLLLVLLVGAGVLQLVPPLPPSWPMTWLACGPLAGALVAAQSRYLRKPP